MWRAERGELGIHFIASIHTFDTTLYPLPKDIENVYKASDLLIFETDLNPDRNQDAYMSFTKAGLYPENESLDDELPASTVGNLRRYCEIRGINFDSFSRQRPWLAWINLENIELSRSGVLISNAIDRQFQRRAKADGKNVEILESQEERFARISMYGIDDQIVLIDKLLNDFRDTKEIIHAVYAAWTNGITSELDAIIGRSYESYPQARELMLSHVNQHWAKKITTYAGLSENPVVILPAHHFAESNSLLHYLELHGFSITQVIPDSQ